MGPGVEPDTMRHDSDWLIKERWMGHGMGGLSLPAASPQPGRQLVLHPPKKPQRDITDSSSVTL